MQKHSDLLDSAAERTEAFTQEAINNVLRQGGQPVLPFKGACHACGEKLEAPKRFCDEECASDYDYIQRRLKANRVVS